MITAAPTTTTATSSPDCTACAAEFSSKGGCNFYDAKQGEFTGNADSLIPAGCMPCVAAAKALCISAASTTQPVVDASTSGYEEMATKGECLDSQRLYVPATPEVVRVRVRVRVRARVGGCVGVGRRGCVC